MKAVAAIVPHNMSTLHCWWQFQIMQLTHRCYHRYHTIQRSAAISNKPFYYYHHAPVSTVWWQAVTTDWRQRPSLCICHVIWQLMMTWCCHGHRVLLLNPGTLAVTGEYLALLSDTWQCNSTTTNLTQLYCHKASKKLVKIFSGLIWSV